MGKQVVKKRNWAFVLYPESAPENWLEHLQQTGLRVAISPLHDKDLDPDGKNPKKAHYHIILAYAGPTSFNVVEALTKSLNQPIPIPLEQVRGYYRYLTHMDNPDKYQYDPRQISTLNGFNIIDFTDLTRSEILEYKRQLVEIIRGQNFTEYAQLCEFLLNNELMDLFDTASSNTLFFNTYITSRRHAGPAQAAQRKENEE